MFWTKVQMTAAIVAATVVVGAGVPATMKLMAAPATPLRQPIDGLRVSAQASQGKGRRRKQAGRSGAGRTVMAWRSTVRNFSTVGPRTDRRCSGKAGRFQVALMADPVVLL